MAPGRARHSLAMMSWLGGGVYIAGLVIVPLLNSRLDLLATHPEDYAGGAFGLLVNASYAALAVALASLAAALYPGKRPAALALAVLIPPALLCAALAFSPVTVARSGSWVSLSVVALAAAPLAISIAMRRRFGAHEWPAIGLAAAVAVSFLCLAASPAAFSGLVNRVFDVLAGSWVVFAALASRSEPATSASAQSSIAW